MNRIIETLLYFSRPAQKVVVPTDLGKILHDALMLVTSRTDSKHVEFEVHVDGDLPLVELDGEQFKQVVLNLLINSVQAIHESGRVSVEARYLPAADEVALSFADSGPGISDSIRNKVFDPFFTTKPAGTGLGLAFAQRIISEACGRIFVEDNAGGGALIKVIIPRVSNSEG
jgi:two-component system, NtrC family, sensor histidine kinase AtoS